MELSRLQSGQLSLKLERVHLEPILDDLAEKYRSKAEDSELQFSVDFPEHLPAVLGNDDRIEQVLVILLDNAMKYTTSQNPAGEQGWVRLEAEETTNYVRLRVRDNGLGIAPEHIRRIFDRFYRVDGSRGGEGTGLGLCLCAWIARAHGGRIEVVSQPGAGSSFTAVLTGARGTVSAGTGRAVGA